MNEESESADNAKGNALSENNIWMIVSVVMALLLLVSLFYNSFAPTAMVTAGVADVVPGTNEQELGTKTLKFVNDNFLSDEGVEGKLGSVSKLAEGLYEVKIELMQDGEVVDTAPVIVSGDATMLILGQVVDMTKPVETPELPDQEPVQVPQLEKAKAEVFVMSFCPHGTTAIEGMAPVAKLLGDKADIEPHFIHYSDYCGYGVDPTTCSAEDFANYCYKDGRDYCGMHGVGEVEENLRQLAILELDEPKFWDYALHLIARMKTGEVTAQNVNETWKASAEATGIDADAVEAWLAENADAVLKAEKELSTARQASGSPTVLINGSKYAGQRTPAAYKLSVCSGFLEEPEECLTSLESNAAADSGTCG